MTELKVTDEIEKRLPECFDAKNFAEDLLLMKYCNTMETCKDPTREMPLIPAELVAGASQTD